MLSAERPCQGDVPRFEGTSVFSIGSARMANLRPDPLTSSSPVRDVIIVGGGPAGLAAAVYLARFRRDVLVVDAGDGRAKLIPSSRNCPGFPDGISGNDLLARLNLQAQSFGAEIVEGQVEAVEPYHSGFAVRVAGTSLRARKIVLATGIVDIAPALPKLRESISTGRVRLCPVCDGYEVIGQRVAVVGPAEKALREAEFLLRYTSRVALLANDPGDICKESRRDAAALNIEIHDTVDDLVPAPYGYDAILADDRRIPLDVIYPAMGCDVRSELAGGLGIRRNNDGYILVDNHQRTNVDGVYAIGDVADALNQIAVAFGQGAIAATDINKCLSREVCLGG